MRDSIRRSRRWFGVSLAAAAIAAWAAEGSAQNQAPHGAKAMDAQQMELSQLLPKPSMTAPASVDPVLWSANIPPENALNPARVALGRKLYFDVRLSADKTVSCATCHDTSRGFTDQRKTSEGIGGQLGKRNAPTTLNAMLLESQFWDGREATVESQALMPIINPIEMGQPNGDAAAKAIAGDAEYQKLFQAAYGRSVNYDDIGRAIGAFERTLVFLDAPLDAYLAGDQNAVNDDAKKGWELFNGKARCVTCHAINRSNPLGTDNRFHNIGVSARHQDFESLAAKAIKELAKDSSKATLERLALETNMSELGRFVITQRYADIGGFRTPQLRNIGITAPYMHDGSIATLWDVMDHYNKGGEANAYLDGGIEALALSDTEINQLVALMFTLTDKHFAAHSEQQEQAQRAMATKARPLRDEELAQRKSVDYAARIQAGSKR